MTKGLFLCSESACLAVFIICSNLRWAVQTPLQDLHVQPQDVLACRLLVQPSMHQKSKFKWFNYYSLAIMLTFILLLFLIGHPESEVFLNYFTFHFIWKTSLNNSPLPRLSCFQNRCHSKLCDKIRHTSIGTGAAMLLVPYAHFTARRFSVKIPALDFVY